MFNIKLSKRLKKIADLIPPNTRVADIGGDHGLLLLYLAQQDKLTAGIVGELNEGPFQNCKSALKKYKDMISVRKGDGLAVIMQGEADTVVIAGMGGSLISQILDNNKEKLIGIKHLIFQPNNSASTLRHWLDTNGYEITDEFLIKERDIIYEIIKAEPGQNNLYTKELDRDMLYSIGPILWDKRDPLLHERIDQEISKIANVIQQLTKSKNPENKHKSQHLSKTLQEWENARKCLS